MLAPASPPCEGPGASRHPLGTASGGKGLALRCARRSSESVGSGGMSGCPVSPEEWQHESSLPTKVYSDSQRSIWREKGRSVSRLGAWPRPTPPRPLRHLVRLVRLINYRFRGNATGRYRSCSRHSGTSRHSGSPCCRYRNCASRHCRYRCSDYRH